MKSVLIVTDAWYPQINGVVQSLDRVAEIIRARGIRVDFLTPADFWTVPMPLYAEIRLSLSPASHVAKKISSLRPDAIHIATEGPLGAAARRFCVRRKIPFATSFHTQFPEYLRARAPFPLSWSYAYLRRFHAAATWCLVPSATVAERLKARGFTNTILWTRGVDLDLFNPSRRNETDLRDTLKGPIFLYVGRVAVEKNIEAFLQLDLPGTKLVVGGGPQLASLKHKYPDAVFAGPQRGEVLARYFASADVFVFPSRTDTFGLVLLEALASGVPVAAYPVQGPLDVVGGSDAAALDTDLQRAALAALDIPRERCRDFAARFTWARSADQFLEYLPDCSGSWPPVS